MIWSWILIFVLTDTLYLLRIYIVITFFLEIFKCIVYTRDEYQNWFLQIFCFKSQASNQQISVSWHVKPRLYLFFVQLDI